eukprot:scaffold74877_cov38-Cyclotella_meneghiniana.AAC.6
MGMIRELHDEARKDIRQNEVLCKEPQKYWDEEINYRIIYGLKVLRAASKTTKLTKRWRKLRTLSPIPSTTGNPGYGRPLTITKTQVDRMMFVLRFILELRLIRAIISKRTLMYIVQAYLKIPKRTSRKDSQEWEYDDELDREIENLERFSTTSDKMEKKSAFQQSEYRDKIKVVVMANERGNEQIGQDKDKVFLASSPDD